MSLRLLLPLLALLLLVTEAQAARFKLTHPGAVVPITSRLKSQAYCEANPDAVLVFDQSLTLSPGSVVAENVGAVTVQATVTVEAVCEFGPSTLRLRYGVLPDSTTSECCDHLPFQLRLTASPLDRFQPTASFSASESFIIIDDDIEEPEEVVRFGLIGGELLTPSFLIDIGSSPAALATLVIEDDDGGPDLSLPGITDTVGGSLGGSADPISLAAIAPLAENCSTATDQNVLDQCAAIVELAESGQSVALAQVLQAISGEELSAQVTGSIDAANQRGAQINGRIAALRGGATGISLDDIAFNYRNQQVPLGMMFNALTDTDNAAQGGNEGFGGGLLDQRLGAFLNVTAVGGDRKASAFEVGFDFDGYSALAGLDWRFTDRFIAGAALGWSDLSSKLEDDGGGLDSSGWSFTGYGTWLISDRAYLDFSFGRLWNDYDQERVVDLSVLGGGFGRAVAAGKTEAEQTSFGFGGGWDIAIGSWVYSPRGSVLWTDSKIDGFIESGAGVNDLIFDDQSFDSLLWTFTQSVSRSFSISSGALQPYLTLDLSRETRNKAFSISPVLRVRPDQRSTPIFIDESDRYFGRGEIGLSFVGARGFQWFASYSQILGYDKLSAWAFRGGVRMEF
ncbi:MAG: autotransporter outer membrane beta-barrel domain-containing protein [Lysobacteraceae bacterium]